MTRDVAMSQWRGRCGRQKRATREAEGLDCSVLTSLWESAEQVVCVFMILCEMFADASAVFSPYRGYSFLALLICSEWIPAFFLSLRQELTQTKETNTPSRFQIAPIENTGFRPAKV
jgi:hypothetical protein